MRDYVPEKPLISIHIPKSGGTSYQSALRMWFGERLHLHYFDEKNKRMPRKTKLKRGILFKRCIPNLCIHGHFNPKRRFGVFDYYPDVDQFLTVVRNPVELHLSNYFHVKRNLRNAESWRDGKAYNLPFKDVDDYLMNTNSFMLQFFPWDMTLEDFQDTLQRHFVHVGTTSNLQKSVDIFADRLGKKTVSVPVKNVSPRDEVPSRSAIDAFRERHRVECAIYEYAVELNK
ncbi:MAG: hypothetical protein SWQ30_05140 [Thermodesulfobacteriota bacterium]|nr:hypothetical protein [Thermodesulfobacteriota bacterium]